jgi:hypothetical protein
MFVMQKVKYYFLYNYNKMTEMIEQGTTITKRINSDTRKKQIQYPCGCRYLFNHQIILEYVCPEHERELIAHHG